jgi:hypothetical protein
MKGGTALVDGPRLKREKDHDSNYPACAVCAGDIPPT